MKGHKMSRKDYKLIAEAFLGTRPNDPALREAASQWRYTLHTVANALEEANPKFNRLRFLEAAGLTR